MVANVAAIRISAGAGCDVHPAPALTTSHQKDALSDRKQQF